VIVCIGTFKYFFTFQLSSVAKPKNIVVLVFTYTSESSSPVYRDFGMNSNNIDSDEAMKQRSDETRG
jgi:hypothetical protein